MHNVLEYLHGVWVDQTIRWKSGSVVGRPLSTHASVDYLFRPRVMERVSLYDLVYGTKQVQTLRDVVWNLGVLPCGCDHGHRFMPLV